MQSQHVSIALIDFCVLALFITSRSYVHF